MSPGPHRDDYNKASDLALGKIINMMCRIQSKKRDGKNEDAQNTSKANHKHVQTCNKKCKSRALLGANTKRNSLSFAF